MFFFYCRRSCVLLLIINITRPLLFLSLLFSCSFTQHHLRNCQNDQRRLVSAYIFSYCVFFVCSPIFLFHFYPSNLFEFLNQSFKKADKIKHKSKNVRENMSSKTTLNNNNKRTKNKHK